MHLRPFHLLTLPFFLVIVLLTSCGGAAAPTATPPPALPTSLPPTSTPQPTATPSPTATPTLTPSPTATATQTPTPLPTATPTPEPTAPPTETPTLEPIATDAPTLEPTTALLTVSFSAEQVRQTVLDLAASQGIPLGNDVEVLLEDGQIKIRSVQIIIAAEIETVFWLSIEAVDGEPSVSIVKAELNGAPLAQDAVADFERAISTGFEQGIRQDLAYEAIESISIENGQMTVVFR